MVDRVSTGISEFDAMVDGGFPRGSTVLLTGQPGTGKSIFALQFICNGIKQGENGIYIYAESHVDSLKAQAKEMGFDLEQLQRDGKLILINIPLVKKKFDILYAVQEARDRIDAKRVVFDSLATFAVNLDLFTIPQAYSGNVASSVTVGSKTDEMYKAWDEDKAPKDNQEKKVIYSHQKRLIYLIIETLRGLGTTNLLITFSGDNNRISTDGISEFIADGIVVFYNELIGSKHIRTMTILKMRTTDHSTHIHDFKIEDDGIKISSEEEVYK